jgi:hypothetical protein
MKKQRIIVMGFMAGIPIAGVIWQHLHYIVGLQRLGHEVYYFEDSARYTYDPETFETLPDYGYAVRMLGKLAKRFDFEGRWCYCARFYFPTETVGLSYRRMRELYGEADLILNVCGAQEMNEDIARSDRLVYVESDPGLEHIEIDQGLPSRLEYMRRHKAFFSFGENVGTPAFPVPLHGFHWQPTRQPIITDFWKSAGPPAPGARFTSVANWNTSGLKDIEWRGEKYLWSKSLEFLKFAEAPMRAGEPFELATNLRDPSTMARLTSLNWKLASPRALSIDIDIYRGYLNSSKGEFTVAKDQYVRLNTAWFSDRSACYLAAGRPVITQETGFTRLYGGNRGLFAFRTLEEIAEAVREINADYALHSKAAFEIAAEYFEATKVLQRLLDGV